MTLENLLPLFKSIHIIGFVAWFGGLFYLVRMFVYHAEAYDKTSDEQKVLLPQFNIMEWRVYKFICNPGMMITWTFGILMLVTYGTEWLKENSWMHVKLTLVFLLTIYHLYCKKIIVKLENKDRVMSSYRFRLFNEIPTLFLACIVILAVYKNFLAFGKAFVGIIVFAGILYLFTYLYKKQRLRKKT